MRESLFLFKGGRLMRDFVVLIPAYRPKMSLPQYVNNLLKKEVTQVVVVDDGNDKEYDQLFWQLSEFDQCTVLVHEENRGKGAGLKTGFRYIKNHYSKLAGVVTADADGQHLVKDVLSVGDRLATREDGFVLGTRNFKRKEMPTRSFIGNTITSRVVQALFGMYIADTQTGLRGISTTELDWVIHLEGNHFDYEMNMLIQMIKKEKQIVRVDIEAVYEEVHISYFDTYTDTKRIAGHIIREVFL